MKILFTADLHIKVGQKNVPREWQKKRYNALFDELEILQKDVDLVVLGGDIFDKIPNMEELELYFNLISRFNTRTLIFDGNHESTRKGKTFLKNLAKASNTLNNHVEVIDGIYKFDNIDIIPYTHIRVFDPDDFTGDILFTHVRGEIKPHVKPEIDLELLSGWGKVYAGDLHAHSNSQRNIVYPGSPLSTSFHRNPITNGVLLIDSEELQEEWIELALPQLIRKTIEEVSLAIPTDFDHTIYEIVGNMSELSGIDMENEVIDKKIINRATEASLSLADLSIAGELIVYLAEVLELDKKSIDRVVGRYNDYIEDT